MDLEWVGGGLFCLMELSPNNNVTDTVVHTQNGQRWLCCIRVFSIMPPQSKHCPSCFL